MQKWLTALLAIGLCVTGVSIVSAAGDSGGTPTCASAASDPDGDGWGWENNASCKVAEASTPAAGSAEGDNYASGDCDYADAHLHGGWGWNPVTNESCEPVDQADEWEDDQSDPPPPVSVGGDCDYADAHLHGGWGWNPVTNESCEPVDEPHYSTCDDHWHYWEDHDPAQLGDGPLFDNHRAPGCELEISGFPPVDYGDCDYSDAHLHDGWGWNPVASESCEPLPATAAGAPGLVTPPQFYDPWDPARPEPGTHEWSQAIFEQQMADFTSEQEEAFDLWLELLAAQERAEAEEEEREWDDETFLMEQEVAPPQVIDPNDTDGDGVPNSEDDYPWDPTRHEEDDEPDDDHTYNPEGGGSLVDTPPDPDDPCHASCA